MVYHVELTARADHNFRNLYRRINAANSGQALAWFNGLERTIFGLDEHPSRCPHAPEDTTVRQLLYGTKPDTYRVISTIDERGQVVTILQIRHGARKPLKARAPKRSRSS